MDTRGYIIIGAVALAEGLMRVSELAVAYLQKDEYQQTPAQSEMFTMIVQLPWMLKPFCGLLSDKVPIFGYRRKSYLMLFGLANFTFWALLAQFGVSSEVVGMATLFGINIATAFCDVVGEAIMVEMSGQVESSNGAAKVVSFYYGIYYLGSLIGIYSSGILLGLLTKQAIFRITSLIPICLCLMALFTREKKQGEAELQALEKQSIRGISRYIMQPPIYKPIIVMILFAMCPVSSVIMFYYFTEELHLGSDFMGTLSLVGAILVIVVTFMYERLLKNMSLKGVLGCGIIIYCGITLSILLQVSRLNTQMGISDKVLAFEDPINQAIVALNWMPLLVLACMMCPKLIEGTMYAILMGFLNASGSLAQYIDSVLASAFDITDSNFSNLPYYIVVIATMPLIMLPMLFLIDIDAVNRVRQCYDGSQSESIKLENDKQ